LRGQPQIAVIVDDAAPPLFIARLLAVVFARLFDASLAGSAGAGRRRSRT
jgi:hypothetical protein